MIDVNEFDLPKDVMAEEVGNINQQDGPDPAYADWERRKSAEAIRYGPNSSAQVILLALKYLFPVEWSNFFTVMLMNPDNYC